MEKTINALKRISNHCLILLEDIFFNKKTIEQIQIDFGYTNKHNAQN